jgi:kynureninase
MLLSDDTELELARQLDRDDPLAALRLEFHVPKADNGQSQIYFVGNSLGLQPTRTSDYISDELQRWSELGVRGHFSGPFPWMPYHEILTESMSKIVGANTNEVVMMNSLTVNLHLMMTTFYRPTAERYKVLIEQHAFPSDHYAVESQIRLHGFSPDSGLICAAPANKNGGSECLTTESLCQRIEEHRNELALILLPGVQYYTGQVLDIARLTGVARRYEIPIGFDLAHAAGNIELKLHEWDVDFAVWCSYKYLNSGPGSVGGCFVHHRHATNTQLPRLAGWWGHDKSTRFLMGTEFQPIATAEGWQLSNAPIFSMAAVRASLEIFDQAGGMGPLIAKSRSLTGYFRELLSRKLPERIQIITPASSPGLAAGCQLSLKVISPNVEGKRVKAQLDAAGIETDWREPDVIRAAPVPLYNQFVEVYRFVDTLCQILR